MAGLPSAWVCSRIACRTRRIPRRISARVSSCSRMFSALASSCKRMFSALYSARCRSKLSTRASSLPNLCCIDPHIPSRAIPPVSPPVSTPVSTGNHGVQSITVTLNPCLLPRWQFTTLSAISKRRRPATGRRYPYRLCQDGRRCHRPEAHCYGLLTGAWLIRTIDCSTLTT